MTGICLSSLQSAGGLIALWRDTIGRADMIGVGRQLIVGTISTPGKGTWILCAIYASNDDDERREVWDAVSRMSTLNLPISCIGDFNVILEDVDKKGLIAPLWLPHQPC